MARSDDPHGTLASETRQALRAVAQLRAQRRWSEAEAALADAAARAVRPEACAAVGDFCCAVGDYRMALIAYGRALAQQDGRADWWFNRAAVRRFLGDLAGAEGDYDHCVALQPADGQAWHNRSELRIQTATRNHITALEQRVASGFAGWQQEVPVRYALAKEYEDLGRHAESWDQLAQAARLRRRHLDYQPAQDLATVDWLIEAFPAGWRGPAGHPSAEPIFILGMPRTGSTLVDRMLGSHTEVFSAGELPHFGQAVVAAARRALPGQCAEPAPQRRTLVAASAQADFAALGIDYLQRTRPQTGHTAHFTDKLPLNHLYCGLIAAALPQARMVHVIRHPMATCYGVFKVLFDQGYPFSYDLDEIADYFIAYRRLMAHWQALLPDRIVEVAYEALIAAPEPQCRTLLGALDLPWQAQCLEFQSNPAPTTTASAAQVRRPIYTSALTQWRHYEVQLAPLRRRLEAVGIACD